MSRAGLAALVSLAAILPDALAAPISVSSAPTSTPNHSDQPREVREALDAFQKGKYGEALNHLRVAAKNHGLAPAEVMLANMYFSDGQDNEGRRILEEAAVHHPSDPEPHLIFGDLAFRERRFSDAQVQYEKADQLLREFSGPPERKRPLLSRALSGKANVAEAQHRFEDAKGDFLAQLEMDPQNPLTHFRLGNVLFALGAPDEALTEFQKAAKLSDAAPSPLLTLVELYKQAGKADEAERRLEAAVKESPGDLRVLLAMAHWQLEMRNDPQAAAPLVARAAQLDPNSTAVSFLRGAIAWSNHELQEAEQLFESITLQEPENLRANNCLAIVLAEQNDARRRQRAWQLVQMSAAANPNSPETAAAMGGVAYLLGDLQRAAQYLQVAVTNGAGRDAAYYLARTQFRQGQLAQAQKTLENALNSVGLFIHLQEARRWRQELNPSKNEP